MSKTNRLEKDRILELLAEADTKWYNAHSDLFKYQEHLEFIAEYIAKNYHRQGKNHE